MKRFSFSSKLRQKAKAPIPTEIERPTQEKEPVLRKWLLRSFLIALVIALAYFVFRDILFTEVKGLVKPEKIVVQSNTDGIFISMVSIGDVVEPNHLIAKVYNPDLEAEIGALKQTLNLLISWRDRLKDENLVRKELTEFNQKLSTLSASLTFSDPETIKKQLKALYRERAAILEDIANLSRRLKQVRELLNVGAATQLEVDSIQSKLVNLQASLSTVNLKISELRERLKKAEEFKVLEKKVEESTGINPMLPNIASIDSEIASIKSRLEVLESKVSNEFISFPHRVKVASILPSGTQVVKGTQLLSVLDMDRFYVVAYLPPDKAKDVYRGQEVKIILPNGAKLKGTVESFEPTLVLKPAVLVGPLEKRTLVLPVRIKISGEKEVRKLVYENMPVTVVFGR